MVSEWLKKPNLFTKITSFLESQIVGKSTGQTRRGGNRSEAWDQETMFSQLAKRSSQNVDSGVRDNKYFRST